MSSTKRFIEGLLLTVPEISPIYIAHVDDNGSLLPHVFMGDVTRFMLLNADIPASKNAIERLLLAVEDGLRSDDNEVSDLVAVSFVENLCGEIEAIRTIIPMLGPTTRSELRSLCGY
jgi:hypothetical protein